MCLRECFLNDSCIKVKSNIIAESISGNSLVYLGKGKNEGRSFYKNDASWGKNDDGSYWVKEAHNIELVLLSILQKQSLKCKSVSYNSGCSLTHLSNEVIQKLDNKELYPALILGRLKGLARHGYVVKLGGWGGRWVILEDGVSILAEVASRRLFA